MNALNRFKLFDSHFHIIDPRFPLAPNQGYLPEPFAVADYLERTKAYDLAGGAVVSGSFQAFDQNYLLAALEALGPGFVGVNPDALFFGTDLPSTRAPRPYADTDLLLVVEALGESLARKVFYENAVDFYRPQGHTQSTPLA